MGFLRRSSGFFTLKTSAGGKLAVREADGAVHASDEDIDQGLLLYGYISPKNLDLCFLIPGSRVRGLVGLHGSDWRGRIIPFQLHRVNGLKSVRLVDPFMRAPVSLRCGGDERAGPEACMAPDATCGEIFRFCPVKTVPVEVRRGGSSLHRLALASSDWPALLDSLIRSGTTCDDVEAVGRLIGPDQKSRLAERLLARPLLVDRLRTACDDIWASEALPDLCAWLAGGRRDLAFPRTVDERFDLFELTGIDGRTPSFSSRCNRAVRQAVEPQRTLCVLATARNEGAYLVDWLAYHRALGVQDFFIYTNDNEDQSDELLLQLNKAGFIRLMFNTFRADVRPQYKAYGHALNVLPEILDFKWVAAIDLDEYVALNPAKYADIFHFLNAMEALGADSIALPWTWHDPGHEIRWQDAPVTERFPAYQPDTFRHVKSIFKPRHFMHSQCHFPFDDPASPRRYMGVDGARTSAKPFRDSDDCDTVWVAHHLFKSLEELLIRRCRNRGDGTVSGVSEGMIPTSYLQLYLRDSLQPWQAETLSNFRLPDDLADRVELERQLILTSGSIRTADEACKAWLPAESARVRAALAHQPRFRVAGSAEARALELLGSMGQTARTARARDPAHTRVPPS